MRKSAQTVLEYVLMIAVVTGLVIAMSTMVRRSIQSMVKVVADQAGLQENAEQDFGASRGHLERMTASVQRDQNKGIRERLGNVTYTYGDTDTSKTFVLTNLGAK